MSALAWKVGGAALVLLLLVGAVFAVLRHGERSGIAQEKVRVEQAHTAAVADARQDERLAADISAGVADRTARTNAVADAVQRATTEELRNALDAVPPAPAGDPLPAAPVGSLSASLNAGIDRANRAAEAADALP